jgi:hypothetical protein
MSKEEGKAQVVGPMATGWVPVLVVLAVLAAAAESQGYWWTVTWSLMAS